MEVFKCNWELRGDVKKEVHFYVDDIRDEVRDRVHKYSDKEGDVVWDLINDYEGVIYNYQAKKIAEAFEVSPFEKSYLTGERYNSYNEIAFDILYKLYYEEEV